MRKSDPFDSSGEAIGYISLEQAILEARRLARQDDRRLLQRLGWDEVVWTELDSEQRGEDFFRVVLQFRRPARGVQEEQTGQEEFIFDDTGSLQDRQVLVWPEPVDAGTVVASPTPPPDSAEPAVFRHKALLISVNRSAAERPLYDATRYAWKISKTRAKEAEVILATRHGLIVGAFIAHDWLEATAANFPGIAEGVDRPGRLGFVGEEAPDSIKNLYVGKRVPDEYRKRGAANPVKYTWRT